MEKFSKLKPKTEFDAPEDEVAYSDDKLEVIKYEDWSLIKEKDAVVPSFIVLYLN